jgi:hypothetical protein
VYAAAGEVTTTVALALWLAALWGGVGGGVAVLANLLAQVVQAGYRWPWRHRKGSRSAYLFVAGGSVVLGAAVAAAASAQMSGPWPAFIMGLTAPSVVRGILGSVEVAERKPEGGGTA